MLMPQGQPEKQINWKWEGTKVRIIPDEEIVPLVDTKLGKATDAKQGVKQLPSDKSPIRYIFCLHSSDL